MEGLNPRKGSKHIYTYLRVCTLRKDAVELELNYHTKENLLSNPNLHG